MLLRRLLTALALACLLLPLPGSAARAAVPHLAGQAAGTVVDCSAFGAPGGLAEALAQGGTITFACSGTLVLPVTVNVTQDTTLDATGQEVTISGGNAVRLFTVAPGVHLTLVHLTLAQGAVVGALGQPGYSGQAGGPGGDALGGAIYNDHGVLTVLDCAFLNNSVAGGTGGNGANAYCTDSYGSGISGGAGGPGGKGAGGAIYNAGGEVHIQGSQFAGNRATGGNGGVGGGYAICSYCCWFFGSCQQWCSHTYFSGPGGPAGSGDGGAVYNQGGMVTVSGSSFADATQGGHGGNISSCPYRYTCHGGAGGPARGGSLYNDGGTMEIAGSAFVGSGATAGTCGSGTDYTPPSYANGGAVYNAGTASLENCTLSGNGAAGHPSYGGALYNASGTLTLGAVTVAGNSAANWGGGAYGGGIANPGGTVVLTNALLADSAPANCAGVVQSGGHNLDSDNSCGLNASGDITGTAALLGPADDNGGPTLTHALLSGSPAIDAGAPGPATDQRGVARPQGNAPDIGAYEALGLGFSSPEYTASEAAGSGVLTVTLTAPSPVTVTVAYSTTAGTASAGVDYQEITGTLSIPPGQATQALAVPLLDDALDEPDETLTVSLAGATHTVLTGPSTATLTIVDDDYADLSGSDKTAEAPVVAPGGLLTYTITLLNSGNITGTVALTDTIPAEVSLLTGTLTGGAVYDEAGNRVTYQGQMPPAEEHDITYVARAGDLLSGTEITNRALIDSGLGAPISRSAAAHVVDTPIAGLTAANDSPTHLGSTTTLTATITEGTHVSYSWNLGDGTTATGAVVTHTYQAAGPYTATVTATNSAGQATATTVVDVDEPVAGLQAGTDSPTRLGTATTLTATVAAGSNVAYTWELGHGDLAAGSVVSHTYPAVGDYTAVVTATNSLGAITATVPVTILPPIRFLFLPLVLRS